MGFEIKRKAEIFKIPDSVAIPNVYFGKRATLYSYEISSC